MIYTREDLRTYVLADAKANGRDTTKEKLFGDEVWKFQRTLRRVEYYHNQKGIWHILYYPMFLWMKYRLHNLSLKLGFTIPINVFREGLSLPHYGTIVVAKGAVVGKNCRLHEGVTIGATNGSNQAANIGDNVFIATGAKIIGDITIANDVAIGANSVVVKSIQEPGTTWGGNPARKISDNDSHANLNRRLFDTKECDI